VQRGIGYVVQGLGTASMFDDARVSSRAACATGGLDDRKRENVKRGGVDRTEKPEKGMSDPKAW
jgi:hypothetical protein